MNRRSHSAQTGLAGKADDARLIWLLIDGLSWRLVNSRAAARPSSTLTKSLSARKPPRAIPLLPLQPNCQTPPSLFSIYSGTEVSQHGLTGYLMPAPTLDAPLACADAFSIWPKNIPMIWEQWANRGIRCRLAAIPFVQKERLGEALLGHSAVYEGPAVSPDVIMHDESLTIPMLGIDLRVEVCGDGLFLHDKTCDASQAPQWLALDFTHHFPIARALAGGNDHCAIALRAARIDGEVALLSLGYRAVNRLPREHAEHSQAYVASDPAQLYRAGRLGKRLDENGEGAAERLLLTLMREVHNSFSADIVDAVRIGDADCVLGYYPVIDLLTHHLLKYIDPDRPPCAASHLCQTLFDTALDWVDELIDDCIKASPDPVCCIAHSDHGMAPVHDDLFPNRFFEQSAWLVYNAQGEPDIARSAVIFHPAENGLMWFHPARLAAAGVDIDTVVARWRSALPPELAQGWDMFKGPAFDETVAPIPQAGWSAEYYLQAPPGTRLLASRSDSLIRRSRKGGDHSVHSADPWLQGILVDVGNHPLGLPDRPALALADIAALVQQGGKGRPAHCVGEDADLAHDFL